MTTVVEWNFENKKTSEVEETFLPLSRVRRWISRDIKATNCDQEHERIQGVDYNVLNTYTLAGNDFFVVISIKFYNT